MPIPKIPTIIVAALSIPDNLDANDLLKFTWEILTGLLARKIKVASYATDGSNVERSVQDKLEQRADRIIDIRIKHPADDGSVHSDITIPILLFGDQPIAILQDPKHLLKTCRNNSFSGAQVPVLPNHPVLFSDILEMGRADSPIYLRDVEKVDRQDDNAATRLFSGATLEWLSKEHSEQRGLISFLFMCGEMIDAYQNRSISIETRVQMILRAHFFFEFWEKFIEIGGYSKKKHFLSPQCVKIIKALTRGFLQLVVIYRDYENGRPLLPWLLGTEAVEHVFGMCRQIVKDFTMLDFHLMIPKLFFQHVRQMERLVPAAILIPILTLVESTYLLYPHIQPTSKSRRLQIVLMKKLTLFLHTSDSRRRISTAQDQVYHPFQAGGQITTHMTRTAMMIVIWMPPASTRTQRKLMITRQC